MTNLKVTIITVCYNSDKTIERTIQSTLSQNYENIEYIVIDGNSSDHTLSVINKYKKKISKIISEPDKGMYDALNKGVRLGTGEIIGILHADDVFAKDNVISKVVKEFQKDDIDALFADCIYEDDKGKQIRYYKSPSDPLKGFKKGLQPAHTTFFCKKELFKKYGIYNLKYRIGSDYDLLLRFLVKHKAKFLYIPQVFVRMRVGGKGNRNIWQILKNNREIKDSAKRNGLPISWLTICKKLFCKWKNSI